MKSLVRSFSLCIAVLFLFSSISYAAIPEYEGQILAGEKVWDAYYNDQTIFYSFCDTNISSDPDLGTNFSNFYINRDNFSSWPKGLEDFYYLSSISDYAFQQTKNGQHVIAVRGWNDEKKHYCSMLLNLSTSEVTHFQTSKSLPPFYGNQDDLTSLSAIEVSDIITKTFGYDQMEYCEGGINICFLPEYGFMYIVGGGCYHMQNKHQDEYGDYYDLDRVDVVMDPFTGKIIASLRMPYTAY